MNFRHHKSQASPPTNLPIASQTEKDDYHEESKRQAKVDDFSPKEDRLTEEDLSFLEEEISLPKFVEQTPEEQKETLRLEEKFSESSEGTKRNKWLYFLVIAVVVVFLGGSFWFWQKNNLKKNQEKIEESKKAEEVAALKVDEDQDGLPDLEELKYGTNPKEEDSDFDGIPDGWEVKYKLNPLDYVDALSDPDEDGLNNLEEYRFGTDPYNADSDGDSYKDGEEVEHGYNPKGSGRLVGQ